MQKRDNPDYPELKNLLKEILEQQNEAANARIQNQLTQLNNVVSQLVGMNGMEHVLTNGFESLTAQLAPLRELTPQREQLDPATNRRLAGIRASLKAPSWNGVNFLDVDRSTTVTMIGETADGMLVTVEHRSAS
jgi:hypothetical protein